MSRVRIQLSRFFLVSVSFLLAVGLPFLILQGQDDRWVVEVADATMSYCSQSDRGLALDSNDHPHIAYGGDFLYYAYHDGAVWHHETVDNTHMVGALAAIALDPAGYPHISYRDGGNNSLKHAYKDAGGWHIETAAYTEAGGGTTIAVDSAGGVHIGYRGEEATGGMMYAYKSSSGWLIEPVDTDQHNIGYDPSIAVDANDWPHMSYYARGDGAVPIYGLRYAYRDTAGWHVETAYNPGRGSSIALDSEGWPHISCLSSDGMTYVYKDALGWHHEIVDSSTYVTELTSIALDAEGYAHISWMEGFDLHYAYQDASGWHIENLDRGYAYPSIALDSEGSPHISYEEPGGYYYPEGLYYASRTDAGWSFQIVHELRAAGKGSSLALDSNVLPHISYMDWKLYDLMYASKNGEDWIIETVDDGRIYADTTSLALDSAQYPHISYCDWYMGEPRLRYAWKDQTGWHIVVVDDPSIGWEGAGENSSLALDEHDRPHIAYAGDDEFGLKYAYFDGEWHIEEVNKDNLARVRPSLALDDSGTPHIAYEVSASGRRGLGYAYKEGGEWQLEVVPEALEQGAWDPSLCLDSEGWPHISYGQEGILRYAYKDGIGWHSEEVVELASADTACSSIDLDAAGSPHISYYDEELADRLMYASRTSNGWSCEVVDEVGSSPGSASSSSLSMDVHGMPHISYYAVRCFDLRYAYDSSEPPPTPTPAVFRVDVEGNVLADQAFYGTAFETGAADVAEWVPVSEPVEPGDVVAFNPLVPEQYRITQSACSSLVAGVISTTPGVTLGGSLVASEKALLALVGIVPVKVTDEGGSIEPGDLLVTSSTPGHAMRWDGPGLCPCVLVGKALEPLIEERGVILVLLTAH